MKKTKIVVSGKLGARGGYTTIGFNPKEPTPKEIRFWDYLCTELKSLNDNNFKARLIFDYVTKYYKD